MTIQVQIGKSDDKTAEGVCNGKPFLAVLDAWGPEGKWRVIDPHNDFSFGERLIIAKAIRESVKLLGFELAHHAN
jgi:hypothetical protein